MKNDFKYHLKNKGNEGQRNDVYANRLYVRLLLTQWEMACWLLLRLIYINDDTEAIIRRNYN